MNRIRQGSQTFRGLSWKAVLGFTRVLSTLPTESLWQRQSPVFFISGGWDPSRLEAIAVRLEAIASRLEAIASRFEAIASTFF